MLLARALTLLGIMTAMVKILTAITEMETLKKDSLDAVPTRQKAQASVLLSLLQRRL
jgi:hypothetical protein